MEDIELKVKELEMKIDEIESQQESLQSLTEHQLDNNDVKALLNDEIAEKGFMTQVEMEQMLNQKHLQLIKWIVGTGISTLAIVVSLFRYLT